MVVSNKKISSVSMAIRTTMSLAESGESLMNKKSPSGFSVKVANTLEEREAVFRLGYDVYLSKGFIKPNANEWLVRNYDFDPETFILIVKDQEKSIVGSVTLVFDGHSKIPAEKIYRKEISDLRLSGAKIVEISRLVIKPEHRNSKDILILLFSYLAVYAYQTAMYSHLVIEVNPRHKSYYKSLLDFEEIGEEKSCPSVQNAPANLLFLTKSRFQTEFAKARKDAQENKKTRSLYPFFPIKTEQESLVAQYLKAQAKPMAPYERSYFGFSESGLNRAVCV